jgi:hypothetical protein
MFMFMFIPDPTVTPSMPGEQVLRQELFLRECHLELRERTEESLGLRWELRELRTGRRGQLSIRPNGASSHASRARPWRTAPQTHSP